MPFILVFHRFQELPIGCEKLLALPHAKLYTLTPNSHHKCAITFIPSEKKVTLKLPNGSLYKILGTPNTRPRATCAIINRPNIKFNIKSFRPIKILRIENNIK